MSNTIFHAPEGVRDIFGRECDKKRYLTRRIEKRMRSYGYQSIETPAFEYSDVFSEEVGSRPLRELYRFFDREGETLALRPDLTPSVARAVSMYFSDETGPIRLCYNGNVYSNNLRYRGDLRERTQMGVELIGDDSPEADAEQIALVIDVLKDAGLSDFQLSLGHVDFFQSLADEAELDEATQDELRRLLTAQNRFGARELCAKLRLRKDLADAFDAIPELFGDRQILQRARALTQNTRARAACDRLIRIADILASYDCEGDVTFDLGLMTSYRYYTGIVFWAFTYGTGDAIIKGGRYDKLLSHFGKDAAAIGFATEIDRLMDALSRQGIRVPIDDVKTMVLYPDALEDSAIRFARSRRAEGMDVACVRFDPACVLDDYRAYGLRNQFGGIIYFDSADEIYAIDLASDEVTKLSSEEVSK